MAGRNTKTGEDDIWADPMFNQPSQFDESMGTDSPFSSSAFNDFTNLGSYGDSPGLRLRTPSKSGPDTTVTAGPHNPSQPPPLQSSASAESSSQDSASDSSSRHKRKVTSESPMSDAMTEQPLKQEDAIPHMGDGQKMQHLDQNFTRPMHDLSLEHDDSNMFDFNSAASSPAQIRDFAPAMSLSAQVNMPASTLASHFHQSPVQTINPGMFQIGSRDDSPVHTSSMMYNNTSPNALFSTPSTDSNEAFGANQMYGGMVQNPTWPGDLGNQFASPTAYSFTPSPVANGATPSIASRGSAVPRTMSKLHIAPISTKSRVETQINLIMTLETPPPGTEHLHLPIHTIAKSKLLAKEDVDKSKTLELHTMLVCTSAMNNPDLQNKAMRAAAAQSNEEIHRRAARLRDANDEDKNSMKDMDDVDKPANGGEVRICSNCIQRERKRAGRKKLKREEEQQHWEKYETERVVVFNSNEYLQFKPPELPQNQRDSGPAADESAYTPPEGSLQVSAAMRIACYCRHQSEKEGFRVIFTMKDQRGNVVAQEMSDSILITDDHKTHMPSFSATVASEDIYRGAPAALNGLAMSYSTGNLLQHSQPFSSSRSTGNLQSLQYGVPQFNPHSHVHHLPTSEYTSQATSATVTPTSLSRPASPTSAGQSGPNKKRKSSTFHRRMPSGLQMTPRVDTSQPPSSSMSSAATMNTPFSPTGNNDAFGQQQSYMTIPNNGGPAQYYGSGPPTPNENAGASLNFGQPHIDYNRAQNGQAYFSHPSSTVPSRSSSPVLQQSRGSMAAYARQPIQTPTNSLSRQPYYNHQAASGSAGAEPEHVSPPTITKITPSEGPVSGGTEVSIYGYNFTNGMQVMFGDQVATTVFYGPQALLATSPPSRPGGVNVTLVIPQGHNDQYASQSRQVFHYKEFDARMMELALRQLNQIQTSGTMPLNQFSNRMANMWVQSNVGQAGIKGQGYEGGNLLAIESEQSPGSLYGQQQQQRLAMRSPPATEAAANDRRSSAMLEEELRVARFMRYIATAS